MAHLDDASRRLALRLQEEEEARAEADGFAASLRLAQQLSAAESAGAAGAGAGGSDDDVVFVRETRADAPKRARPAPPSGFASSGAAARAPLPRDGLGIFLSRAPGASERHNEQSWLMSDLFPLVNGRPPLWCLASNVSFRCAWFLDACPLLRDIPKVFLLCDHRYLKELKADYEQELYPALRDKFQFHAPPMAITDGSGAVDDNSYGTHHAKFTLCFYPHALVVCIHTSNDGDEDGNVATQGLWTQSFPRKTEGCPVGSDFETQLVRYLARTQWPGGALPDGTRVDVVSLTDFDFSAAKAALVASVPGSHSGAELSWFGHLRVRAMLKAEVFDAALVGSDLVFQPAAIAGVNRPFIAQLLESFGAGADAAGTPLGVPPLDEVAGRPRAHVIWPTNDEIQNSSYGWGVGGVLPATKAHLASPLLRPCLAHWRDAADTEGRGRYPPHIKTFWRVDAQCRLAYALLASHNFSRAAWGELKLDDTRLYVKSYELGVLLLPSLAGGARLVTTAHGPHGTRAGLSMSADGATLALRCPFALPPVRYGATDEPWCLEGAPLDKPDAHGVVITMMPDGSGRGYARR